MLGCAIVMDYRNNADGIDDEWISAGNYEIDGEGKLIPAKAHVQPPHDPKSLKTSGSECKQSWLQTPFKSI